MPFLGPFTPPRTGTLLFECLVLVVLRCNCFVSFRLTFPIFYYASCLRGIAIHTLESCETCLLLLVNVIEYIQGHVKLRFSLHN